MMKSSLTTLLCCLFALSALVAQNSGGESAPTFTLTIDGKEYTVTEGQSLQLEGTFNNPEVSIAQAKHMTFNQRSLAFHYPRHFAFEYEESMGLDMWTLDGNNFVIMYFVLAGPAGVDDLVEGMVSQFGKENCKISKTTKTLGDRKLPGKRILVELIGQKLHLDILSIDSQQTPSRFLIFHDSLDDDGEASQESAETMDMIDKTISYE